MKALRWKRRQSQCVAPVHVSSHAAQLSTTTAATPTVTTSAQRAAAGRQAIADCPEAFEDLRSEGDRELVEEAGANDENVLKALDTVGELTADLATSSGSSSQQPLRRNTRSSWALTDPSAERPSQMKTPTWPTNLQIPSTPASWIAPAHRRRRRTQA